MMNDKYCKDCYNRVTWYHGDNTFTYTCCVMGKGKYSIEETEKCENCKYFIDFIERNNHNEKLHNDI